MAQLVPLDLIFSCSGVTAEEAGLLAAKNIVRSVSINGATYVEPMSLEFTVIAEDIFMPLPSKGSILSGLKRDS
jgi:hypothetical protein